MVDVHDKKTRSYNMSRIRSRDTKPEMVVRRLCHSLGLRYSLHNKKLPGTPDIVFRKHNTVIEVRGCYWHRHSCSKGQVVPQTDTKRWVEHFRKNVARDKNNLVLLENQGWKVLIIWQCDTEYIANFRKMICSHFQR